MSTTAPAGTQWLTHVGASTRRWQLVIFTTRVLQLLAEISAFWLFSLLIEAIVIEHKEVELAQVLPFGVAMLCWGGLRNVADMLATRTKQKVENAIEDNVYGYIHKRQLEVTRQYSPTYFQQLLMDDLPDIGNYLTQYTVQKWLSAVVPFFVVGIVLPVNYVVGLSLLITLPTVPLFMILVGKGAATLHRKHFVALERLGNMFSDRLKGLTLITSSGQHARQLERLENASRIVNRNTMKVVSVAFLSSSVLDFFATISIALVAVFIGFTLLGEIQFGPDISLQQGLFMLLVAPLLFSELKRLGQFYHQKEKAIASAQHFESLFLEPVSQKEKQPFDHASWLNFKVQAPPLYAKRLSLRKGDWVRLNGVSGSGKSALLEALIGFRKATHSLSGNIGFLSQEVAILNDTLAFNLHLGHNNDDTLLTQPSQLSGNTFSAEYLIGSLNNVGLLPWFTQLEDGLFSELGDYPPLSGGEAHRLALARMLLHNKDIVLLDEPTAHLTEKQHKEIAELIHKTLRHKTVIWASHKTLPDVWFNKHWHIQNGEIQVVK